MYTNVIGKCFMLFVSAIIIQSVFQTSICFPGGEIQARMSEKAMKEKWARGGILSHGKITQNDTKATVTKGPWSRGGHHQDFNMREKNASR